jgi:hypothetical protein
MKLMKKIRKVLQPLLNLSLNLNLAILKMRIAWRTSLHFVNHFTFIRSLSESGQRGKPPRSLV